MLENRIKQIKKINPKKAIYPLILLTYFGVIALFLFFSLKFFTRQLNLILAAGDSLENGQNQPALDLAGYSLLEKKFKLAPYVAEPAPVVSEPAAIASSTGSSTPALDPSASSGQATTSTAP